MPCLPLAGTVAAVLDAAVRTAGVLLRARTRRIPAVAFCRSPYRAFLSALLPTVVFLSPYASHCSSRYFAGYNRCLLKRATRHV